MHQASSASGALAGTLPAADAAAPAPLFRLSTLDGAARQGVLRQIHDDWSVQLAGELVAGVELLQFEQAGCPRPPFPEGPHLQLGHGEILALDPAAAVQLVKERLHVQAAPPLAQAVQLPLTAVALLWLAAPAQVQAPLPYRDRLLAEERRRDVFILRNGDRLEGTLLELDSSAQCVLDSKGKRLTIPAERLALIAFSSALVIRPPLPPMHGFLVLSNGSRLRCRAAAVEPDQRTLTVRTLAAGILKVPLPDVCALELAQPRVTPLTELTPLAYEHTPYLGIAWPLVHSRNAAGGPLCLAGHTYDGGLGMHTASTVRYRLGKRYRWFEALVGIDEHAGRAGSARVRVLLDGVPCKLERAGLLTGAAPPLRLRLAVAAVEELTLGADFATRGSVQGRVNWANARLLR